MESGSAIDPVRFLERAPVFRGIAASRVEALMKGCSQRWVKRGQIVYRKRAIAGACYFLLAGKVKLFLLSAGGDERITDVISPGQFFGEVELFSRQPYLAFAEALQPSRYIVIGREIMLRAMEDEPLLAVRMLAQVAMRRISMEQDLESWCFEGGDCRLMRYLLGDGSSARAAGGEATVRLGLRKGEIAARIGVAPETLSRILREWADQGLITVLGSEITLHAPFFARAEAIAGGEPPAESRLEAALAAAR